MKNIALLLLIITTFVVYAFSSCCALYYGFLFVAHRFNPDFVKIDSCLDQGGMWNYSERVCDYE